MRVNEQGVSLVIGLGEVGKPILTILKKHDPETLGIDVEPVEVGQRVGTIHICFPYLDAGQFQKAAVGYIRKYAPKVVVVHSTAIPGTTRSIEEESGVSCVYSPVRGKHTKMLDELLSYVKFVAGTNAEATQQIQQQFEATGMKSETMSSPEALELAKLLETTYFGVLIAWAQEMNRFAELVNADYVEVGKFFREIAYLPGVLFQPGHIGGHCVMPNIGLLEQRFESEFLDLIKRSNEARKLELEAQQQLGMKERLQPLALA